MGESGVVTLLATGDVGPVHGPADGYPASHYIGLVLPTMRAADVVFGNCERQYSRRGVKNPESPHGCQPPEMANIFGECGFDAVTLANNHMYDFGPDALLDTRALMLGKNIAVTGAGKDTGEAWEAAVVERNGVRIGFLGFSSVHPDGSAAGPGKPGVAELRVLTEYEHRGPHAPVRVKTAPDAGDLARIADHVRALKQRVDVVLVAFHWGAIWVPRIICDYQVTTAHALIDAGADAIVGHHPHLPKAIEVYNGAPIYYSLGNFCMTKPFPSDLWSEEPWRHGALRNHTDLDPAYPLLPYGKDAMRCLMASFRLSKDGVEAAGFVPMMIDTLYRPEPLAPGDPRFDDMVSYMEWASTGFFHEFDVHGGEVGISLATVAAADSRAARPEIEHQ